MESRFNLPLLKNIQFYPQKVFYSRDFTLNKLQFVFKYQTALIFFFWNLTIQFRKQKLSLMSGNDFILHNSARYVQIQINPSTIALERKLFGLPSHFEIHSRLGSLSEYNHKPC